MLTLFRQSVPPTWIDYNGHMNDGYYAVLFSKASDEFINYIHMDEAYRKRTQLSIFTAEMHICYLKEAKLHEEVMVKGQLLGFDKKRIQLFLSLYNKKDEQLATQEGLYLHIDMRGPRVVSFQPEILTEVVDLWEQHRLLPQPKQVGRSIVTLKPSSVNNK